MREPRWIRLQEAITIQEMQIAETGGRAGIRDKALLESALARPIHHYLYALRERDAIPKLGAIYASALVRNHPFVDGNKRIGLVLAAVFLEKNGFRLEASQVEAYEMFLGLAAGNIKDKTLIAWFVKNCRPLKRSPGGVRE